MDHSPSKLLNYITAPDVIISSAVLASSAVPGVLNAAELVMKLSNGRQVPYSETGRRWRDGSLRTDIPTTTVNFFNVHFTIVSQVNPHVVLFFYHHKGTVGRPSSHRGGRGWYVSQYMDFSRKASLTRFKRRGGFIMSSVEHLLKLDLQKQLRALRDLDLIPSLLSLVFVQKFDGVVTILPKVSANDYFNILTDPTRSRMKNYLSVGESRTWPKLAMIRNRMDIEKSLSFWKSHVRKLHRLDLDRKNKKTLLWDQIKSIVVSDSGSDTTSIHPRPPFSLLNFSESEGMETPSEFEELK